MYHTFSHHNIGVYKGNRAFSMSGADSAENFKIIIAIIKHHFRMFSLYFLQNFSKS